MRSAQGMPVQMIGIMVLVVLVVVAVAVFFFAGLSEQGGVLGQASNQTVGGLNSNLQASLKCVPPPVCCDPADCPGATNCCCDCSVCPSSCA
jgi:hypothetical protein